MPRMALLGLFRRRPHERAGFELYGTAVRAAREPVLYERLGVADTIDGRFDLVGLHVVLLIRRLRGAAPPGPALAQAAFDAMFSDMDDMLRELGLDLGVPRRVKAMWEAFHGRAQAYEAALDAGDREALAAALGRNVWRGEAPPAGAATALAALVFAQADALAAQPDAALMQGRASFLPAGPAIGGEAAA